MTAEMVDMAEMADAVEVADAGDAALLEVPLDGLVSEACEQYAGYLTLNKTTMDTEVCQTQAWVARERGERLMAQDTERMVRAEKDGESDQRQAH